MRRAHRWLLGLVISLLGCTSAPPPTMDGGVDSGGPVDAGSGPSCRSEGVSCDAPPEGNCCAGLSCCYFATDGGPIRAVCSDPALPSMGCI